MEWTAVTVVIALVGLGAAIVRPIVSLTKSITKLTVVVEHLQKDVSAMTSKNSKSHERIWAHSEAQDRRLEEHDGRITGLEHGR